MQNSLQMKLESQFQSHLEPDHDYVSAGYSTPQFASAFPHRVVGDKHAHPWVYLRREVPHVWCVDERNPLMGFLSVDESSVLHTLAQAIPDADALEIGCHRGWSTAHLAAGVKHLDVIDPILSDPLHMADVEASLENAGVRSRCSLHAGNSPAKLLELAAGRAMPWSVIFVDGDHEPDGPLWDAQTVANCAAKDAIIIFHDLASPVVTEGLAYLRALGWHCMVFQTMQIMGVAWRGNVKIPAHIPDPAVKWQLPDHLRTFKISGESAAGYAERVQKFFADFSSMDPHARAHALIPLGTATAGAQPVDIRMLQADVLAARARAESAGADLLAARARIDGLSFEIADGRANYESLAARLIAGQERLDVRQGELARQMRQSGEVAEEFRIADLRLREDLAEKIRRSDGTGAELRIANQLLREDLAEKLRRSDETAEELRAANQRLRGEMAELHVELGAAKSKAAEIESIHGSKRLLLRRLLTKRG